MVDDDLLLGYMTGLVSGWLQTPCEGALMPLNKVGVVFKFRNLHGFSPAMHDRYDRLMSDWQTNEELLPFLREFKLDNVEWLIGDGDDSSASWYTDRWSHVWVRQLNLLG